jgi:uncharacterized repeat protein (TIGR01451 family)
MTLGIAGVWAPIGASAAGPYGGSASSDIVHAKALNLPGAVQLADVSVAPSVAEMNSAGVKGGGNAHSRATNLDVDVLSGTIPLTGLLVEADHRAPGKPGPVVSELLTVPADPLLNATVARATAHSRWNTAGCVAPGTPISMAKSELADANIITGTPAGNALVALDNAQGDTVYSNSTTELVNVPGQAGKGVKSETLTQVTAVTLFKGTPNQLTINVVAPPVVTATATGQPGGAKVTYSEPILQVVDATGNILGELNAADANQQLDLSPLAILDIGHLTATTKGDGTEASGFADLLQITILNVPGSIEPLAQLTIAGGTVSAKVPSGGVDCSGGTSTGGGGDDGGGNAACGTGNPLRELQIGSSTLKIAAGKTFTYTIAVSNRGKCTLTNVHVEDTINGPPGSKVIKTDPKADSVDGLKVTWDDIGPLKPNQMKVLTVVVQVPTDAQNGKKYSSEAKVTATGGGQNFSKGVKVNLPEVAAAGTGACNLVQSRVGPSHKEVQPGETFNIYITLLNSGGAPCPGVTVKYPIADSLIFVDCTDDCTNSDRTVTWVVGEIGPGDGQTLVATLRVPDNATNGTVYHHTVTITSGSMSLDRSADGPRVTGVSVLAAFPSAGGETSVGGASLPRTGAYIGTLVLIGLALMAGGEVLRRRSRRWMPDLT